MPRLLTHAELAAAIGIKLSTVYVWARKGRIPKVEVSPKVARFDLEEVVAALKERPLMVK